MKKQYLHHAIDAAIRAGHAIMEVYSRPFDVELKKDQSPLTEADLRAHQVIVDQLCSIGLPVLSEEGRDIPFEERRDWPLFWMVDPLDGTKEFVKRNGEFTVNIALIQDGESVAGVIFAPTLNVLYFGWEEGNAYKAKINPEPNGLLESFESLIKRSEVLPIDYDQDHFKVIGSRSHRSAETESYFSELEKVHGDLEIITMGSSLKICLVAEGVAQIYPRFAPTMEWDTAAGHAIARAAGKDIIDRSTGKSMRYNKENLLNNWFVVQ